MNKYTKQLILFENDLNYQKTDPRQVGAKNCSTTTKTDKKLLLSHFEE